MKDKRRLIEWGKNVLIVLLTASAVWLLTMTPLVQDSGLLDLFAPQESPGVGAGGVRQGTAMLPVRLAITGEEGRCGVQYDEARLEELFSPLGALLGDALASAGTPQTLSEGDWQRYLRGTGIYFDFGGGVPLSALERWLQGPGNGALTGSARRVLLCAGTDDQVLLCWQEADGGGFFTCRTGLTQALHLEPAAEGAASNGAYFAFEDQELSQRLAPYTLITEGGEGGTEYTVSAPLAAEGSSAAVLSALSFSSQDHAPVSGGEVYVDGGDRLVVNVNGTVTYRAARSGRRGGRGPDAGGGGPGAHVRRGPAVPHVRSGDGWRGAGAVRLPAGRLPGVPGQRGLGGGILDLGRLRHPVHPALPELRRQRGGDPAAACGQGGGHASRPDLGAAGAGDPVPGRRRYRGGPRLGGGVNTGTEGGTAGPWNGGS